MHERDGDLPDHLVALRRQRNGDEAPPFIVGLNRGGVLRGHLLILLRRPRIKDGVGRRFAQQLAIAAVEEHFIATLVGCIGIAKRHTIVRIILVRVRSTRRIGGQTVHNFHLLLEDLSHDIGVALWLILAEGVVDAAHKRGEDEGGEAGVPQGETKADQVG